MGANASAFTSLANPASAQPAGLQSASNMMGMVQSIAQIGSGFSSFMAGNQEADAERNQARLALYDAQMNATNIARQGAQQESEQAMEYASAGVTLAGSPALVLAQTRSLVQQQVQAAQQQGINRAQLMNTQANRTAAQGRAALFSGIEGAGVSQIQNKFKNSQIFSPAASVSNTANPLPPIATFNQ